MRPWSVHFASLAFTLPFVFTVPSLTAQAAGQAPIPVYHANARDVVVDVVVTKGRDEPVPGLRKQDFEVFEDGKPQAIDYFEEHMANAQLAGAVQPLPAMPPNVYINVPPAPPSDSVNVLLLDALNTDQQDQTYVRQQILKFLKGMQPRTRAAIFTLSSRLRMIQGFTSDSSELVAALNDPKYGDLINKTVDSRSMQDKKDAAWEVEKKIMMANGHMTAGIEAFQQFQRESADVQAVDRTGMTLQALQILARYLAAVPGRKNLIWFSSNFPVMVFPQTGQTEQAEVMNTYLHGYSKAIRGTADMLTVARVAVYPVGAEGVMSEHIADPDIETNHGGPVDYEGGGGSGQRGGGTTTPYVHENAARSDKIMSMAQLAQDTGGQAFYNTNDLNAATQKAIAEGSHYYTLVYSPKNKKMDGSYRRISVKMKDGKYQLAYRQGYNADETPAIVAAASADPLHPLMAMGMPNATQVLYAVRVLPVATQPEAGAARAGQNTKLAGAVTRYSVDFMIRWTDVQLQPAPDNRHTGSVEVQLFAYDRDGKPVNWMGGTQRMDLTPELYAAIQRSGVPAHFDIDLPANQEIDLETGVYDPNTGKAGTLSIPLHPVLTTTAATSQPASEH